MFRHLCRSIFAWGKHCKYSGVILAVLVGSCLLAAVVVLHDERSAAQPVTELSRKTYGQGSVVTSLRVFAGEEETQKEESLEITVDERAYTREEAAGMLGDALTEVETLMLGANHSLDEVCQDLNLMTEIPGFPIEISWETDRYDLVNVYGELNQENIREETLNSGESEEGAAGILVGLKVYLTYVQDPGVQIMQEMRARVCLPDAEKDVWIRGLAAAVEEAKEESRTRESVKLPSQVEGETVTFRNQRDPRGWYILALGCVVSLLLVLHQRQEAREEKERRARQMMQDYPEIINKLTLLIGAGMTVQGAWNKIALDYEGQKNNRGERFAYEEMLTTCREMQSGVTESEGYENFGRRCKVLAYRKMAALLTQNLRKGTKGLTDLLAAEAVQAFEERKAAARKRGEEAGTKLLAPMFLMLATVLVMVIVPAFLSIQL